MRLQVTAKNVAEYEQNGMTLWQATLRPESSDPDTNQYFGQSASINISGLLQRPDFRAGDEVAITVEPHGASRAGRGRRESSSG